MNTLPQLKSELVNFPDPRLARGQAGLSLRPSIDTILRRMNPTSSVPNPAVNIEGEDKLSILEQEKADLRDQKREFARVQAESMERIRVARELELLISARESVLDEREAQLSARLSDSVTDRKVSALEKSLNDTRQALDLAYKAQVEMEEIILNLRTEVESIKASEPEAKAPPSLESVDGYQNITHESLAEQVAFLREREAFIEQSENVLFEKAQHMQEWEARLEQTEHDRVRNPRTA